MTKKKLIELVSKETGYTQDCVSNVANTLLEFIAQEIANGSVVRVYPLGTFRAVKRNSRKGRDMTTGKEIIIPSKFVPKFKASSSLLEMMDSLRGGENERGVY